MTTRVEDVPAGASVWEVDLYRMLSTHVAKERELLEAYVNDARSTGSAALTYLVDLLVEDEKRHHRLFQDLAASLKSEAELRGTEPDVPRLDFTRRNAGAVREVTERLLANEREDAKELKRLKRAMRDVEDTTLWSLLVDLMLRDTEKHIAILGFAQRQARRAN